MVQSPNGALQRLTHGSVKSGQTASHANLETRSKENSYMVLFSSWCTFQLKVACGCKEHKIREYPTTFGKCPNQSSTVQAHINTALQKFDLY